MNKGEGPVEVRAYAGSRGDEEPRAVLVGGRFRGVAEITARWREPEGCHFKVLLEDGTCCHLLFREAEATWWMVEGPGKRSPNSRA